MRRIGFLTVTVAVILSTVLLVFTGCVKGGVPAPATYTITASVSEDYTLTPSVTIAEAGEEITVAVELKNSDKYITGVKFNDSACSEKDGNYCFTMPEENVTLTATTGEYSEDLEDGMAEFVVSNLKTIQKDSDNAELIVNFRKASYMTILKSNIVSSNQNVIPEDAIEVKKHNDFNSGLIDYATVTIDTSKVNYGTTWLTMYFENGNVSSQDATIVVKITVEERITYDKWDETIAFDVQGIDGFEDKSFCVQLWVKNDSIDDTHAFRDLKADKNGKVIVQFRYIVNQQYRLDFGVKGAGEEKWTWCELPEVVSGGSTGEGFNQYQDGYLSFVHEGGTMNILVTMGKQ